MEIALARPALKTLWAERPEGVRSLENWLLCWVLLPNIGFWLLWIVGGPPRAVPILVTGLVGIVLHRAPFPLKFAGFATAMILSALYFVAALFNLRIPRTEAPLQPLTHGIAWMVRDFSSCNARLWNDKLGQISLATTTLFWGVSGNLRVIVFAWAAAALGYGTTQASSLVGVVALGTAAGAVLASLRMRLDQATNVIPLGIVMGVLVIGLDLISNVWVAAPFLIVLGAIGGYLVVPMNALLQHRGANLMGAGRSIAVQNFNEQACILGLGAFYTGLTRFGLSAFTAIAIFGLLVAGTMWIIRRWHLSNCARYPEEIKHLLSIARLDKH